MDTSLDLSTCFRVDRDAIVVTFACAVAQGACVGGCGCRGVCVFSCLGKAEDGRWCFVEAFFYGGDGAVDDFVYSVDYVVD